jgi:hypothetical protein
MGSRTTPGDDDRIEVLTPDGRHVPRAGPDAGRMRQLAWVVTLLVLAGALAVFASSTSPEADPEVPAPEAFPEPSSLGVPTFNFSRQRLVVPLPIVVDPEVTLPEPSVNVWGPVPETTPDRVHSAVYTTPDGAVLWLTSDATSRFRVPRGGANAAVGDAPARALVSGDAHVLEWDAGGYGFRLVGWHTDLEALLGIAEGVESSAVWSLIAGAPPEPTELPAGTRLVVAESSPSGVDGIGTMGWSTRYRVSGETGIVVRITAAAGRPEPIGVIETLARDAVVEVHGLPALGFDFDASRDAGSPVRSRLLWGDETVMFEATSAVLSLADLVAVAEAAQLGIGGRSG